MDLIKKWETVLDYTSPNTEELKEKEKWMVAYLMEEIDQKYLKGKIDFEFAKLMVPQVRRNKGPLEEISINNKIHYVIDNYEGNTTDKETYAIDPDEVKITKDYMCHMVNYEFRNCYKKENDEWILV
jgi:hypothetical protein